MKLYKALKIRKGLVGEIARLKHQLSTKNSFLVGSKNAEKFDAVSCEKQLMEKINELVTLKYIINEANREIQTKIYLLGEYKALISFWDSIDVNQGSHTGSYSDVIKEFDVHFTEEMCDEKVKEYQLKVNALQDEIDEFNHLTEIPWGETEE